MTMEATTAKIPLRNVVDIRASRLNAAVNTMAHAEAKFLEIADAYFMVAPISRPPSALRKTTAQTARGNFIACAAQFLGAQGRTNRNVTRLSCSCRAQKPSSVFCARFFKIFSKKTFAKPDKRPDAKQAAAPAATAAAPALVVAEEAMLCMRTSTQPAMSKGCDAHCVFDNLRPSKGTEKSAVKSVLDCDNER